MIWSRYERPDIEPGPAICWSFRLAGWDVHADREGKFFFTMMAAFADLERDMLREPTMAGHRARRVATAGGRP